jgi:hypothetical protein
MKEQLKERISPAPSPKYTRASTSRGTCAMHSDRWRDNGKGWGWQDGWLCVTERQGERVGGGRMAVCHRESTHLLCSPRVRDGTALGREPDTCAPAVCDDAQPGAVPAQVPQCAQRVCVLLGANVCLKKTAVRREAEGAVHATYHSAVRTAQHTLQICRSSMVGDYSS